MSVQAVVDEWRAIRAELDGLDAPMKEPEGAGEEFELQANLQMMMNLSQTFVSPLLDRLRYRLKEIEECSQRPKINIQKLLLYGERLTTSIEPPPMYNDPKGEDANCYPGRKFPCPDSAMLDVSVFSVNQQHLLTPVMDKWETIVNPIPVAQTPAATPAASVTSTDEDKKEDAVKEKRSKEDTRKRDLLFDEDSSSD